MKIAGGGLRGIGTDHPFMVGQSIGKRDWRMGGWPAEATAYILVIVMFFDYAIGSLSCKLGGQAGPERKRRQGHESSGRSRGSRRASWRRKNGSSPPCQWLQCQVKSVYRGVKL
jgi:hypothetical protein